MTSQWHVTRAGLHPRPLRRSNLSWPHLAPQPTRRRGRTHCDIGDGGCCQGATGARPWCGRQLPVARGTHTGDSASRGSGKRAPSRGNGKAGRKELLLWPVRSSPRQPRGGNFGGRAESPRPQALAAPVPPAGGRDCVTPRDAAGSIRGCGKTSVPASSPAAAAAERGGCATSAEPVTARRPPAVVCARRMQPLEIWPSPRESRALTSGVVPAT